MKILYFDISAILIMLIMIAVLFVQNKQWNIINKLLLILYINVLFTTVFDLWSEAYNIWFLANETDSVFRYFLYYGYFLSRNMTPLLFQLYLFSITDTWHILKKKPWLKPLFAAPYIVVCLLLFSNVFFHNVFYFNNELIYTRGPMFYGLHLCAFVYFVSGIIFLLAYRKVFPIDKLTALICFYPWNLLAILVQAFIPEYLVEMFLNTVSLFMVSSIVQRPEEVIDPVTGILSHIAYRADMKKAFYLRKPFRIVVAQLVNYQSLLTILGSDACGGLMKQLSTDMKNAFKDPLFSADLYYLENGMFAAVSGSDDSEYCRRAARSFSDSVNGSLQMGKLILEMNSCLCVFRCPEDFEDYDKMMSFVNSFSSFLPADGSVTCLEDEDDRQQFNIHLRNDIDHIVSNAIEKNLFKMYYQPIYSVKEKRFTSAEALIRLKDEKYGFISPELLITAAERNGTILQIGDFVLDSVCRFMAECLGMKLPIEYIELNLSMKQCVQMDLKDKVLFYLSKYELKPEQINLEITETAANTAQDIVEENIRSLSEHGVAFSLDDYGTGYSNLSRVISLPFKIVKIDKSMTDKVFDSKINAVLKNNLRLLKEIGIEIVVEGIEKKAQLCQFEEMGCDFVQGYYYSAPLPEKDFLKFIKTENHQ
ncbi:MAG: EAL domain-containing protein [Clostridiales bacterium]|nr:EAL domain-containing protein [Clostridiales bacterium]